MNYEQKYKEALERARVYHTGGSTIDAHITEVIFPELAESEDERIRKELIEHIKANYEADYVLFKKFSPDDVIAWLERQRDYDRLIEEMKKRKELLSKEKEKATSTNDKLSLGGRIAMLQELLAFNICNTTDNDEPKFKVGDWVIDNFGDIYQIETATEIESEHIFGYTIVGGGYFNDNSNVRLWSINDANDGDVLAWDNSKCIALFKNIYDEDSFNSYGLVGHCTGIFEPRQAYHDIEGAHPATKEQRDLLFQKMKEAGYEWNDEKKELTKIEDKTLDADKVIEWLKTKVYDDSTYGMAMIEKFKQYFKL